MIPEKVCTRCGELKSHAEYNGKLVSGAMGPKFYPASRCRKCSTALNRVYQSENKVAIKARKKLRDASRDVDEYPLPPAIRPHARERIRLSHHKRRAQKLNSTSQHYTPEQWEDLKQKYGNRCMRCGSECKLTVDHIVPLSDGGSNSIDNIQALCQPCNSTKYTTTIDYRTEGLVVIHI